MSNFDFNSTDIGKHISILSVSEITVYSEYDNSLVPGKIGSHRYKILYFDSDYILANRTYSKDICRFILNWKKR